MSDADLQQLVTDLALARAQHEIAIKNLEDATLRAPVASTISKRMIKSGESVNPNQVVFELVEAYEEGDSIRVAELQGILEKLTTGGSAGASAPARRDPRPPGSRSP